MTSERYYRIGGLGVCFAGWQPEAEATDWLPLFATQDKTCDIRIELIKVETIDFPTDVTPEWEEPYVRSCRIDSRIHRYYRRDNKQNGCDYAHLSFDTAAPQLRTLELCDRGFPLNEKQVLACIGSEELFLCFFRTVLHSSCIDIGGRAVLFAGVSGIGKSTQAALWEEYEHAKVCNGDRTLLRCEKDTEYACGLPYAGTSGICNAYELPIAAIVFLGQGSTNRITRLPPTEAVKRLLTQFPVPKWSADAIGHAMESAVRVAFHLPVYHLVCLPDRTAVELLKQTLSEE